jgi:hypothetical protein
MHERRPRVAEALEDIAIGIEVIRGSLMHGGQQRSNKTDRAGRPLGSWTRSPIGQRVEHAEWESQLDADHASAALPRPPL